MLGRLAGSPGHIDDLRLLLAHIGVVARAVQFHIQTAVVGATGHVDAQFGVVQGGTIHARHVGGHTVGIGQEDVVRHILDGGALAHVGQGAVAAATVQDDVDVARLDSGHIPVHAAHVLLETQCCSGPVASVLGVALEGIDAGIVAVAILAVAVVVVSITDIDLDFACLVVVVHHIVADDDRVLVDHAVDHHTRLDGGAAGDVERGGSLGATGVGGGAVGGIDHLGGVVAGADVHVEGAGVVAAHLVDGGISANERLLHIVLPVEAGADEQSAVALLVHHLVALGHGGVAIGGAQLHLEFALGARDVELHVPAALVHAADGGLVGHASGTASLDALLQDGLPTGVHVVRIEQARRARHCQDEHIGLYHMFAHAVGEPAVRVVVRNVLERVVVVDKGHRIAAHLVVGNEAGIVQHGIVALVVLERLVHLELQGEVESRALARILGIGLVDPTLQIGLVAVEELAHAEGGTRGHVIHRQILGVVALHIIVTEAGVAQVVQQEVEVLNHVALHILAVVAQVLAPCATGEAGLTDFVTVAIQIGLLAIIVLARIRHNIVIGILGLPCDVIVIARSTC